MEIVFLGTSGMQPTAERNLQSTLVLDREETIMIDCGEGTQRQMKLAKIKSTKLTRVLITHNHADHILGLGGLIRNLSANQYSGTLEIYGPKGIKEVYNNLVTNTPGEINIKVNVHEISEGLVFSSRYIEVHALKLKHSITCFGYSIKEKDKLKMNTSYLEKFGLKQHPILGKLQKGEDIIWEGKKITVEKATTKILGKKVTILLDTMKCDNCIKLAEDSDLLITEATFSSKDKETAKEHNHMTTEDAASIAKASRSKKLILTHFGQRYKDTSELEKEAKKIFKQVSCAKDLMKVKL